MNRAACRFDKELLIYVCRFLKELLQKDELVLSHHKHYSDSATKMLKVVRGISLEERKRFFVSFLKTVKL